MPRRNVKTYRKVDWLTILLYCSLILIGWVNIYGADYNFEGQTEGFSRSILQAIWIGSAFLLAFIIILIESKVFNIFAYFFYGLILALLIATVFLAPNINGSHSWLILGPLRIQPAEFSKFITALALARFMSTYEFNFSNPRCYLKVLLIILVPALIIVLQREVGSALVFLAFFLVLYREGMSGTFLLIGVCLAVLFIVVLRCSIYEIGQNVGSWGMLCALLFLITASVAATWQQDRKQKALPYILVSFALLFAVAIGLNRWSSIRINYEHVAFAEIIGLTAYFLIFSFIKRNKKIAFAALFLIGMSGFCFSVNYIFDNVLEQHQQMRIKVFLGMEDDPTGTGYNVNQSKIAIGSGGFLGKGFLNGTQTKLNYVPEQVTDFIFCNIGEEFGFIGSVSVLLLYLFFLYRLIVLAERQFDPFNRIYGYCVVSIFFFHVLINIGMVLGLVPVIGIPLPLISYGGSSLWGFTILLFIFLKMDASQSEQLH